MQLVVLNNNHSRHKYNCFALMVQYSPLYLLYMDDSLFGEDKKYMFSNNSHIELYLDINF